MKGYPALLLLLILASPYDCLAKDKKKKGGCKCQKQSFMALRHIQSDPAAYPADPVTGFSGLRTEVYRVMNERYEVGGDFFSKALAVVSIPKGKTVFRYKTVCSFCREFSKGQLRTA